MMKTILVLEDDPKIAIALAVRLEAAGYNVLTAPDGVRGLKLALVNRPDLIVMDIWMPVGLGLSVAQRLKDLGFEKTPVIFITASRLKGLREAADNLGAAGYFEKPYDPEQLLGAVHQALERHTFTASTAGKFQLVSRATP
jgi:DNA-binding response OmpR family regulator